MHPNKMCSFNVLRAYCFADIHLRYSQSMSLTQALLTAANDKTPPQKKTWQSQSIWSSDITDK